MPRRSPHPPLPGCQDAFLQPCPTLRAEAAGLRRCALRIDVHRRPRCCARVCCGGKSSARRPSPGRTCVRLAPAGLPLSLSSRQTRLCRQLQYVHARETPLTHCSRTTGSKAELPGAVALGVETRVAAAGSHTHTRPRGGLFLFPVLACTWLPDLVGAWRLCLYLGRGGTNGVHSSLGRLSEPTRPSRVRRR